MACSPDDLHFSAGSSTLTDIETPPLGSNISTPALSRGSTSDLREGEVLPDPHVAVTPSMLSAYAQMRGPMQPATGRLPDPLHDGLFDDNFEQVELRLSPLPSPVMKEFMMEGWKKGDTVYWDPNLAAKTAAARKAAMGDEPALKQDAGKADLQPDIYQQALNGGEIKFRYFKGSCAIKNEAIGYKGDQGLANHGYIPINELWADPDSMRDVSQALHGVQPIDDGDLPAQTRGPRVLTLEEQDKEYEYFMDYVSDDEGDPRDNRISPETFAAWAKDSAKRIPQKGEEITDELQDWVRPKSKEHDETEKKPTKVQVQPQFDIETGSAFTGYYELDSNPSPLMSAQGVDAMRKPVQFTKSYPQVSKDIDKMAFAGAPPSLVHSTASTVPDTLNSEGAHFAFDNAEYPDGWQEIKDRLLSLEEKRKTAVYDFMTKYRKQEALQRRKTQLDRENYFLRRCWAQKQQYFRYLKERVEKDTLAIYRTLALGRAIDADIERDLDAVREKEEEQEYLLNRLGHSTVDEVADMLPSRKSYSF